MTIDVGATFPVDVCVDSPRGRVSVSQFLGTGPVVIAFHRMWCPFCQQAARELAAVKDQLDTFGARVLLVYRDDLDTVRNTCSERGLAFDCLSDSARELENAAELKSFSIGRYAAFSPAKLVRSLRAGNHLGMSKTGRLQGRGTFVLDRNGRIVYAHRAVTAADIPPITHVLAAVESASDNCQTGQCTI
jgi:peroxiredoxin